jgi:hypothetical protein
LRLLQGANIFANIRETENVRELQQFVNVSVHCCFFLLGLFFDPSNGGSMFPRNFDKVLIDYTTSNSGDSVFRPKKGIVYV